VEPFLPEKVKEQHMLMLQPSPLLRQKGTWLIRPVVFEFHTQQSPAKLMHHGFDHGMVGRTGGLFQIDNQIVHSLFSSFRRRAT
jgi:hypothetical protein